MRAIQLYKDHVCVEWIIKVHSTRNCFSEGTNYYIVIVNDERKCSKGNYTLLTDGL